MTPMQSLSGTNVQERRLGSIGREDGDASALHADATLEQCRQAGRAAGAVLADVRRDPSLVVHLRRRTRALREVIYSGLSNASLSRLHQNWLVGQRSAHCVGRKGAPSFSGQHARLPGRPASAARAGAESMCPGRTLPRYASRAIRAGALRRVRPRRTGAVRARNGRGVGRQAGAPTRDPGADPPGCSGEPRRTARAHHKSSHDLRVPLEGDLLSHQRRRPSSRSRPARCVRRHGRQLARSLPERRRRGGQAVEPQRTRGR